MPPLSGSPSNLYVNPRRPPKNISDFVFMPLGVATAWLLLSWPIFYTRRVGMPSDAFMLSPASEFSFLVFVVGVGLVSIGPGFLLSNLVLWAIPPLRRKQDQLCQGEGKEVLNQANRGLARFSLVLFLVFYPLSFAAGLNYFALAPNGVHYRHYLATQARVYPWTDITQIRSKWYRRKEPNGRYEIVFSDRSSVDLAAYSERNFFAAYARLSASLQQAPAFKFYFDADASVSCPVSWIPYFATRPGHQTPE
jgi:hypothetical protein